eukprot:gene5998-12086_t
MGGGISSISDSFQAVSIESKNLKAGLSPTITPNERDLSLALFLELFSDDAFRSRFLSFLRSNFSDTRFCYFQHLELMSSGSRSTEIKLLGEDILRSYTALPDPGNHKTSLIADFLKRNTAKKIQSANGSHRDVVSSIAKVFEEIMLISMMSVFPHYILGHSRITSIKGKQTECVSIDKHETITIEEDDTTPDIQYPMSLNLVRSLHKGLEYVKSDTINRISYLNSWTTSLFSLLENMPCSISISSSTESDYPLIFVNSYFEKMTGYTRHEVIGKNCRFLQDMNAPENEANVDLLKEYLSEGRSCRVTLTNLTKNKRKFKNLLAVKPVFDNNGKQLFVLGVQLDVEESCVENLIFINDFLLMFPDTIISSNAY